MTTEELKAFKALLGLAKGLYEDDSWFGDRRDAGPIIEQAEKVLYGDHSSTVRDDSGRPRGDGG